MRIIALTLAVLAVVGCRRHRDFADMYDPYDQPIGDYDPTLMVDPAFYDNVTTSELGTEARGSAKTVDWTFGSVDEGTTYTGGMIVVDRIFRQDADNFFNVTLRLRNRDANPIKIEWKIALFNSEGTRMSGLTDWTGDKETWHNASIDSRGSTLVSNGARLKGASVFRLHVRRSGASDEGFPEQGKDSTQESIDSLKRSLGQ